jgi:hypothetical protein
LKLPQQQQYSGIIIFSSPPLLRAILLMNGFLIFPSFPMPQLNPEYGL